ncbi:MAG: hypothetical protein ACP5HK_07605, partial [Acidilobus sp.]
ALMRGAMSSFPLSALAALLAVGVGVAAYALPTSATGGREANVDCLTSDLPPGADEALIRELLRERRERLGAV